MKSFIIFLLIVFIAALITVPGHEQFNKYLAKKKKNIDTCLGGTRHNSYKVFTIDYVDYCEPFTGRQLEPLIRKPTHTDKYLGLFGSFWKL
jgi:hypothetical protein